MEITSIEVSYCFAGYIDSVFSLLANNNSILACQDASGFQLVVTVVRGQHSLGKLMRPCKLV
jgi:hypothetical protein